MVSKITDYVSGDKLVVFLLSEMNKAANDEEVFDEDIELDF